MTQYHNPLYYLLIALLLTACNAIEAQFAPTTSPILHPNTDMHTAPINSIAIDAKGQYLVTSSIDKTARVWSLLDGKLLRVLRPPIEEGHESKIYAVALSPEGKTVAVGGWTGYRWDKKVSIYLFDRLLGELQQRLAGLLNGISHLAYSSEIESPYLVASLVGTDDNGIRIYDTRKNMLVAKDTDYGDSSYWAEFDTQGRLVTSCEDGFIRLYDKNFKLLAKQTAPGGKKPYAVRFSQTGDKIVVGFQDSTQVNVLSGQDLTVLYSPSTQGLDNGYLHMVAWSADGRGLVAGGEYNDGTGMHPILHWSNAGQGVRSQWSSGASDKIVDIRALPDGNIVFGAGDPVFGVLSARGEKVVYRATEADSRDKESFQNSSNLEVNNVEENKVMLLESISTEQKPPQQAIQNQLLPAVTLSFPEDGSIFFSPKMDFRYQLRHPTNEPVTLLKVLQDGRPLPVTATPAMTLNTEQTLTIPLPQRDVQISLIAENQFGASAPATVQLHWKNPENPKPTIIKPQLYVLAVGVRQYDDTSIQTLQYADKDAQDFVKLWQQQSGKLYREVTVKPLLNVTREEIIKGLQWIERKVTQSDVGMVFFSGHGETADNGRYYFLPRDAKADDLRTTAIPDSEIKETVSRLAGKALFFIDSCHADNVMGKKGNTTANLDQLANELASAENGVVVFTASTGKQLSQEDAVWQNGAFTKALIEGLSGKADMNQDGAIAISELNYYLTERVKELTKGEQSPMTTMPKTVQDFPVAVVQ